MNTEEQVALDDWVKTMKAAAPKIRDVGMVAKAIHRKLITAPEWRVVEGDLSVSAEKPSAPTASWNTGGPTVNYVPPGTIKQVSLEGHVNNEEGKP